jgi:hypothetical protein
MAQKRNNHNNLLPWFQEDHGQLPASYLKSCEKFFKEIGRHRPQGTSSMRQPGTMKNKNK